MCKHLVLPNIAMSRKVSPRSTWMTEIKTDRPMPWSRFATRLPDYNGLKLGPLLQFLGTFHPHRSLFVTSKNVHQTAPIAIHKNTCFLSFWTLTLQFDKCLPKGPIVSAWTRSKMDTTPGLTWPGLDAAGMVLMTTTKVNQIICPSSILDSSTLPIGSSFS